MSTIIAVHPNFRRFSAQNTGSRLLLPLLFPTTVIFLPHGKLRTDPFKPKNIGVGDHA
jgi:hypothetical protein